VKVKPLARALVIGFGAAFLVALVCAGWCWFSSSSVTVTSFRDVRARHIASDGVLLDRYGIAIHELRVDFRGRSLAWTPIGEISPLFLRIVVASEDKRFYRHNGFDSIALVYGGVMSVLGKGRRGASTITMQVAALTNQSLQPAAVGRTLGQKWRQVRLARALERSWTKEEILEAYLNLISFRGELQGVAAASRGLFQKNPSGLNAAESLILASLIRSPNARMATVIQRAARLGETTKQTVSRDDLTATAKSALTRPYSIERFASLAPHPAQYLLKSGMQSVRCSIDGRLQAFVQALLADHISSVKGQNVSDGAVLVVDNRSGEILAYVGNSGRLSSASFVDGVRSLRQPGSTMKPFLYALALEKKIVTAASLLSDTPLDIPTERGIYRPENYDRRFKGLVPARTALASSLNIPAVRVLLMTGPDSFVRKLKDLGFTELRDADYYGYSLALGTLDTSLYEMVNAYRTLANMGMWGELTIEPGKGRGYMRRAFSPEAAFIVASILSDREARSITFGFENPLATPFWSAAKTGTSKDMRDNWCLGFSEKYTVGVWVGNFSGAPMWDVSGITGAAPVWNEVMTYLHRQERSASPKPPRGVVARTYLADGGETGKEWFIAGTAPVSVESERAVSDPARILYPPAEVIIAVDPDIPVTNQKVFFEASGASRGLRWFLNGEPVGNGPLCAWTPVAGEYSLVLTDRDDHPLDEIAFKVRE
jgi:penicillin-binding protein 1C